ncbi:LysR family transcriptional regulator [Devosia sp. YIM 151766]|uniref:LysR family transcriptional regulator n=1 Tax=Devosia sp. YIM 151766 TaxID=3017325 RepID=UPI00255CD6FE|nr:LysR family transcriptional regulator [Devosia sp. YIM 151766]WIY52557.1 LysR family transcriptional regulator [Devosia sp. YIM 151766]
MDLLTLIMVHAFFETGSIRHAGRLIDKSPSTVSAALVRFENAVGIPMVRREGRALSLTLEAERRAPALALIDAEARRLCSLATPGGAVLPIGVEALRRIIVVAHRGSIRKAAKVIAIGQPQLTRQIGDVERNLGLEIFKRSRHGVVSTENGAIVLAIAGRILDAWDKLSFAAAEHFRRAVSTWSLGTIMPLGHESFVAEMLARLSARWADERPRQPLSIIGLTADELMLGLKSRRFDAVLLDHLNIPLEYEKEVLSESKLCVVGSNLEQPLADFGALFRSRKIALLSKKSGLRQVCDRFMADVVGQDDFYNLDILESDSIPVIVRLVSDYGYVTVLQRSVVGHLPYDFWQMPIPDEYTQALLLAWRKNALPEQVRTSLIKHLRGL